MGVKTVYTCDRCGIAVDFEQKMAGEEVLSEGWSNIDFWHSNTKGEVGIHGFYLCPSCASKFSKFMEGEAE